MAVSKIFLKRYIKEFKSAFDAAGIVRAQVDRRHGCQRAEMERQLFGPVRIMMAMYKVIRLPRDLASRPP